MDEGIGPTAFPAILCALRAIKAMTDPSPRPATPGPLADLDDWETAHEARESSRKGDPGSFRDYRNNVRAGVAEFYRLNHANQTLDFVLEKKRQYLPRTRTVMGIWEAMEYPQHAGRRQRPGHRSVADRAPDADGRGDPRRRPPALVHPDGADPRPRQGPLPVRRAAVGGRGRHLPGRLPLLRLDRLPRVLRREPRLARPRVPDAAAGSTRRTAGSTRSTCRGGTTSTSTTSSRITSPRRAWR